MVVDGPSHLATGIARANGRVRCESVALTNNSARPMLCGEVAFVAPVARGLSHEAGSHTRGSGPASA